MNIVERAKNILLTPKAEWQKIDGESHTVQGLYTQYVCILAAIPAVATFIGFSLIGMSFFKLPLMTGLAMMVVNYALALAMVYVLALIIDALAPNFGGQKNFLQAIKVAAFAPTASWLAGIFSIIPQLSILGILGLYSLYLLYLGLPILMKTPEEKSVGYVVVVIIAAIVVAVVINVISGLFMSARMAF